jgi:hypothetical protein
VDVLLERAQPVDVVLDGGWRLTAHVADVAADHVDVAADGGFALPGGIDQCRATLTWRTKIGVAQRHGILVPQAGGLLRLHGADPAEEVQRRRFVRVPAECTAALVAAGDRRVLARTRDISIGGMLLETAPALPIHELVRFAVDLGEAIKVIGTGEIVRGSTDGERAVRFERLDARNEQTLSRFVATRQRELLRAAAAQRPPSVEVGRWLAEDPQAG